MTDDLSDDWAINAPERFSHYVIARGLDAYATVCGDHSGSRLNEWERANAATPRCRKCVGRLDLPHDVDADDGQPATDLVHRFWDEELTEDERDLFRRGRASSDPALVAKSAAAGMVLTPGHPDVPVRGAARGREGEADGTHAGAAALPQPVFARELLRLGEQDPPDRTDPSE